MLARVTGKWRESMRINARWRCDPGSHYLGGQHVRCLKGDSGSREFQGVFWPEESTPFDDDELQGELDNEYQYSSTIVREWSSVIAAAVCTTGFWK